MRYSRQIYLQTIITSALLLKHNFNEAVSEILLIEEITKTNMMSVSVLSVCSLGSLLLLDRYGSPYLKRLIIGPGKVYNHYTFSFCKEEGRHCKGIFLCCWLLHIHSLNFTYLQIVILVTSLQHKKVKIWPMRIFFFWYMLFCPAFMLVFNISHLIFLAYFFYMLFNRVLLGLRISLFWKFTRYFIKKTRG